MGTPSASMKRFLELCGQTAPLPITTTTELRTKQANKQCNGCDYIFGWYDSDDQQNLILIESRGAHKKFLGLWNGHSWKESLTRFERNPKMVSQLTFCFATQSLTNVWTHLFKVNVKLHEMCIRWVRVWYLMLQNRCKTVYNTCARTKCINCIVCSCNCYSGLSNTHCK